jgi:hypothetical protein
VNKIWSQAGVSFKFTGSSYEVVYDSWLDTTAYNWDVALQEFSMGNYTDIAGLNRHHHAIDIYFTNTITMQLLPLAPKTILAGLTTTKWSLPWACIVASNSPGYSSDPKKRHAEIVRALAHELGHYIMKDGGHSDESHNIMYEIAYYDVRFLTIEQAKKVRASGVTPSHTR